MFEKIQAMIADTLMIDPSEITEESRFIDDLHADSLDLIQMIIAMEREFGKKFDDDQLKTIKTVGDVIALLK